MRTSRIVDGMVEETIIRASEVSTMSRADLVGKIAEAQASIDRATIDMGVKEQYKAGWMLYLNELDAAK